MSSSDYFFACQRWKCKCWRGIRQSLGTRSSVEFVPLEEEKDDVDSDEQRKDPVVKAKETVPMEEVVEETSDKDIETSL